MNLGSWYIIVIMKDKFFKPKDKKEIEIEKSFIVNREKRLTKQERLEEAKKILERKFNKTKI